MKLKGTLLASVVIILGFCFIHLWLSRMSIAYPFDPKGFERLAIAYYKLRIFVKYGFMYPPNHLDLRISTRSPRVKLGDSLMITVFLKNLSQFTYVIHHPLVAPQDVLRFSAIRQDGTKLDERPSVHRRTIEDFLFLGPDDVFNKEIDLSTDKAFRLSQGRPIVRIMKPGTYRLKMLFQSCCLSTDIEHVRELREKLKQRLWRLWPDLLSKESNEVVIEVSRTR